MPPKRLKLTKLFLRNKIRLSPSFFSASLFAQVSQLFSFSLFFFPLFPTISPRFFPALLCFLQYFLPLAHAPSLSQEYPHGYFVQQSRQNRRFLTLFPIKAIINSTRLFEGCNIGYCPRPSPHPIICMTDDMYDKNTPFRTVGTASTS